ncbi:MAG: septal ring lytic transglycosylase RlpA family protein [Sandarakinorhabdus sp.]|nr:septal ring lytic transglycosylase RlpA family protein [Sandarakinorhabdus sp.]
MRSPTARTSAIVAALLLAGCAGGRAPPAPAKTPPTSKAAVPGVKIGKPYQVFGVWYYPADDRNYDQHGIASWYGPGFHALDTANGERYDQDGLTAAHKTLPMPSYVEVENLDNGRKLTVRINDRGPFVDGRIIDLSRKSAQLLGVDRAGTAHVRVRRLFPDAKDLPPPPPPARPVIAAEPVADAPIVAAPAVTTVDLPGPALVTSGVYFVQVAALGDPGRISWLKGYLSVFGPVVTEAAASGLTRVRLGPFADATSANAMLAKVRAAGYGEARLVPPGPRP